MRKNLIALIFAAVLMPVLAVCAFAENSSSMTVLYDGDGIHIRGTIDSAGGLPAAIIVAKPGKSEIDLIAANTPQALNNTAFHIETFSTPQNGVFEERYIPLITDSVEKGICKIYIRIMNKPEFYEIASFSVIPKPEIENLIKSFNETAASKYGTIFTADNLLVLEKLGAKVNIYNAVVNKNNFYNMLALGKPFKEDTINKQNTAAVFINAFNRVCAFMELNESNDIKNIIEKYNGVYWSLPFSDEKGLMLLNEEYQNILFDDMEKVFYENAEQLKTDYLNKVSICIFQSCKTRNELISAINNNNTRYGLDLEKLENSKLTEYYISEIYNLMLDGCKNCTSFIDINTLYENSIVAILDEIKSKEKKQGNGPGSNGGGKKDVGVAYVKTEETQSKQETKEFSDVPKSNWAYDYINKMYQKGIVNGRSEGKFEPNNTILREEFVKVIVVASKITSSSNKINFKDVEKGGYWESYISSAVDSGIISGIGQNLFGSGKELTRQDAAVILNRIIIKNNIAVEKSENKFNDSAVISDYANEAVENTVSLGLFKGDDKNNFSPESSITRAEVCAVISRLIDILGK